jgi:hypothetical protein
VEKKLQGERPLLKKRLQIPGFQPFAEIIARCWNTDPNNRPTAKEIVEEVKRLNSSGSSSVLSS